MSSVRLDDPESAVSSLKKDMHSLTLSDRRDDKRGDHSVDGYPVSDRHNKRTKGSNEETESKKMKPEVRYYFFGVKYAILEVDLMISHNLSIQ
jgi:hypothetical protein